MTIQEQNDGSRLIGGKPFRTGFLNAFMPVHEIEQKRVLYAKRENVLFWGSDVYHYTSLAGFQGIISSGGFWASDYRFLNDTEEVKDGIDLAIRVLSHYRRRLKNKKFDDILVAVCERLLSPSQSGGLVACFSLSRDSLEQWRGYGASGGVCLRLSSPTADEAHLFFAPDQMPFRVFYDGRPKVVLLLSIINRYLKEFVADQLAMPDE